MTDDLESTGGLESTVARLREMHGYAADDDRPRAALFLALTISDLVSRLPADDSRLGALAAEGLACLDESGDTSAAGQAARLRLADAVPADSGDSEPETIRFGDADMNWDLNWSDLRGPTEAARNMRAMLPFLSSLMPPGTPLTAALASLTEVLDAFDKGEWSPRHDEALASATGLVEAADLGSGMGLMLRMMAMTVRLGRCQRALRKGGKPDWPTSAEFDELISGLESDDSLGAGLGIPSYQAMDGLQHLYIATFVMARLQADIMQHGVRQDPAWRNEMLQLIDKANDRLRQAPAAYAGQIQQMRGQLAQVYAVLSQAAPARGAPPGPPMPPSGAPGKEAAAASTAQDRDGRRGDPAPPPPPPAPAPASTPAPAQRTGATPNDGPARGGRRIGDLPVDRLSRTLIDGMKVLAEHVDGPMSGMLHALAALNDSTTSGRWLPEYDEHISRVRAEAERLALRGETRPEGVLFSGIAAIGSGMRAHHLSSSSRPEDHPAADDFAAIAADAESVLEGFDRAEEVRPGFTAAVGEIPAMMHVLAGMMLVDMAQLGAQPRDEILARARGHYDRLPPDFLRQMPIFRDMAVLERVIEGRVGLGDEAVRAVIAKNQNVWDSSGGDLQLALDAAARAGRSREPEDISAAIMDLQLVWTGLAAGSPLRSRVLISLAGTQKLLAMLTSDPGTAIDSLGAAIEAVRVATGPDETRAATYALVSTLSLMACLRQRRGPFREAEAVLREALADASPEDWALRTALTTGIGATTGMLALAEHDDALLTRSRELIADAAQILPGEMPDGSWYATAKSLNGWATMHAVYGPDPGLVPVALDLIDRMERVLGTRPELAGELHGSGGGPEAPDGVSEAEMLRQARLLLDAEQPSPEESPTPPDNGQGKDPEEALREASDLLGLAAEGTSSRQPLSPEGRPAPDSLRAVTADLHQAMADADDTRVRHQVDRLLGLGHAELYWADAPARDGEALREAIVHLNRALLSAEHALPSIEWADMLGVLARCYREAALRHGHERAREAAERTARAGLRELARCVMIAGGTSEALAVAARANDIVTRATGWCLDDDLHRSAVEIAETGRGLVLGSIVISGRVEGTLRGAGQDDAADAWRAGTDAGRAAALSALSATSEGERLLTAPSRQENSLAMMGTRFDALVYLVPPAEADDGGPARTAHALLVRPVLGELEPLPLPGLTSAGMAPLRAYVAALDAALTAFRPETASGGGFRGGPGGQDWADALDGLGRWAHERIIGPLIGHARRWDLDHLPHLALIPLGALAAIPYAAAWTADEATGARRYALDDLVLSYGASARLLAEVSRRPRQDLSRRVVLVSDPAGQFPMTRRATKAISARQYRDAEIYGLKSAPDGAATSAALLSALPGRDRPGASLLQLSTHATAVPEPRLRTRDGWLPLAGILEQARDRPPDAPGGLVITNACLTDSARTAHDESLTLATGFLAAGATSVIGTRWPVDDDTTAVLSLRLHHHLHFGCPPAEALRRAQLDLLRPREEMRATLDSHLAAIDDSRLSHPASWAGQVHHGI